MSPFHFYENTAELKPIGDSKCLRGHNTYLLLTGGGEGVKCAAVKGAGSPSSDDYKM